MFTKKIVFLAVPVLAVTTVAFAGCSQQKGASGDAQIIEQNNTGSTSATPNSSSSNNNNNNSTADVAALPQLTGEWKKVDTNIKWKVNDAPVTVVAYTAPSSSNLESLCTNIVANVEQWAKRNNYVPPAESDSYFTHGVENIVKNPSDAISKCSDKDSSTSLGDSFDDIDGRTAVGGGKNFIIKTGKEGEVSEECSVTVSDSGSSNLCQGSEKVGAPEDYTIVFAY